VEALPVSDLPKPRQAGSLSDIARRDFHYFWASRHDMKAPQKFNHEETKSTKVFSALLRALRFFVVEFHSFRASPEQDEPHRDLIINN
ncbi:MAG: hypothetical protein ACREA2_06740, partial [Blastocatellia bacterium]